MSSSSGPFTRLVSRVVFVLVIVGAAQFILLTVQVSGARTNFLRLCPELASTGEEPFRRTIVDALRLDGIEVDPKDIKIDKKSSGVATIDLVAVKEAKILIFPIHKELVLHSEIAFDSAL